MGEDVVDGIKRVFTDMTGASISDVAMKKIEGHSGAFEKEKENERHGRIPQKYACTFYHFSKEDVDWEPSLWDPGEDFGEPKFCSVVDLIPAVAGADMGQEEVKKSWYVESLLSLMDWDWPLIQQKWGGEWKGPKPHEAVGQEGQVQEPKPVIEATKYNNNRAPHRTASISLMQQ